MELPQIGARKERSDAAENRERILAAARRLLEEQGVSSLSMDAVAAEAGVGKGTIFRRFGSRAGLTHALLDEYMRTFQDAVISGPPPLGPGAAPGERLEAFCLRLIEIQQSHMALALAAEPGADGRPPGAYSFLLLHVQRLVAELKPNADARVLAHLILGCLAPPILQRLQANPEIDQEGLKTGLIALLRGVTT
jgi:AcrR family transcriptional regulator